MTFTYNTKTVMHWHSNWLASFGFVHGLTPWRST